MKSANNTHEVEIINGIKRLGRSVSYSELMSHLVDEMRVVSVRTLKKYLKSMVEEHKLVRSEHDRSVFYTVASVLWQNTLPTDDETLKKAIMDYADYMSNFENIFPKINLLDKVLVSVQFYQNLQILRSWHEMNYFIETKKTREGNEHNLISPTIFNPELYNAQQNMITGLIDHLFNMISADPDAKTIHFLIELKTVAYPDMPLLDVIRKHNREVTKLEKKNDAVMIWTNADGKPLETSASTKKIPLKNKKKSSYTFSKSVKPSFKM